MRSASCPVSWCVALAWVLALSVSAGRAENSTPAERLGAKVPSVSVRDTKGNPVTLEECRGKKATVVVFLSFECPVCTSYVHPLAELAKTYGPKGVGFVGISVQEDETPAQLLQHTREFGISFLLAQDRNHEAADALKAVATPEAFLLDADGVVRYRGRIDNSYASRLKKNIRTTTHELKDALDAVLSGKPVQVASTQPIGCAIPRETSARANGSLTFYHDVLPILQNRCQGCHRPGEIGPFSLMNYQQAKNWALDIKDYTQTRKMPPWKPVAGGPFHNERRLSDDEIATLAAWVDAGTPEGNRADAPPEKQFTEGWQLGQPDLVLQPSDDFHVGPSGRDVFRCFVLPTHEAEDRYVTAVEVRPGNPRVLHHVLIFIDTQGRGRDLEAAEAKNEKDPTATDYGPGYFSGMGVGFLPRGTLGGWAPGNIGRHLPDGAAYFLPKGADVVVQVHYHRDGRAEADRTRIGVYFSPKPVAKRYQGLVVAGGQGRFGTFFVLPAGNNHVALHGSTWVDQDCDIHSVMPHMHLLGRQAKITLIPPKGPPQTLVDVKDWDYNWQEVYFFEKPVHVKAGSRIEIDAVYDNSAKNPNNPSDPPRAVTFGEQTTDEMCFGFIGATTDKPGRIRQHRGDSPTPPKGRRSDRPNNKPA